MSLSFCSFSSGSSGNSYIVKSENTSLIIDVGISGKKIIEGIEHIQEDIDKIQAVLITHEHIDHVKSLKTINKKLPNLKTYANQNTWPYIKDLVPEERQRVFKPEEEFDIGDITIKPFRTNHDAAESVGFSFYNKDKQVSIITDTGCISENIYEQIKDADILIIEANHDVNVLRMCKYPYQIKRRIAGNEGHLSNEAAAECICRMIEERPKKRQVLLAHLSKENNSPDLARITVKNILEENNFYVGKDIEMDIIAKDVISPVYIIK